ncbi:hypothetical protein ACIHFE_33700 [Streptomyces sp. NPDC052396]|uniref:hypothetical protein n=1 Tax=Streptomyces sp. NPDC052396 TaxID=3365689 RepID=UPI0037D11499
MSYGSGSPGAGTDAARRAGVVPLELQLAGGPRNAEAITTYLDYRHRRRLDSTNPHLLISRNTATAPVGTFWLDKLVKPLPVGLDRLRQDRILEEDLANGAAPLRLAHVFSLGAKTSLRYTTAVAVSATEQESIRG